MKNLIQALNERYTVKAYDSSKKISADDFAQIEYVLRYSPSSTNLQPSHFVIASDEAGKARIAKAASGFYSFNTAKIQNASHVIVFASKVFADETHLNQVLAKEEQDGRFPNAEIKAGQDAGRRAFLNMHRFELKDEAHWHAKQTYLTMGATLLAAAQLGIDSTTMEGVDLAILDEEFGLRAKGYTAQAVIALGYGSKDDFNRTTPKSRLSEDVLIEHI